MFEINDYQVRANSTAGPDRDLIVVALGLTGEAGEVADVVKKLEYHGHSYSEEMFDKIIDELGDVLWYVALGADVVGVSLETIAKRNIDKLKARYPDGFDAARSKARYESV